METNYQRLLNKIATGYYIMSHATYEKLGDSKPIFDYHLKSIGAVKTELEFPSKHFKITIG